MSDIIRFYCSDYQSKESIDKDCWDFLTELQESLDEDSTGIYKIDISGSAAEFSDRKEKISLINSARTMTDKYAGLITYKGRTLLIRSRFDSEGGGMYFLNHILHKCGIASVVSFDNSPGARTDDVSGIDKIIAAVFLSMLKEAFSVGVYRQYRSFEYNDSSPKGQINIARHIRLNPVSNGKVAYSPREYTVNNPVNRLILTAWQLLSRAGGAAVMININREYRKPIDFLKAELGYQPIDRRSLNNILLQAEDPVVHPVYRRYEELRRLCIEIVRQFKCELFRESSRKAVGILFDMNNMWELFIEKNELIKDARPRDESMDILYADDNSGGKGKVILEPDFCVGEKGGYKAVFDAKYKKKWGRVYKGESWDMREDTFQLISYICCYNVRVGGIVFPMYRTAENEALPHSRRYTLHKDGSERNFLLMPFFLPDADGCRSQEQYESLMKECVESFRSEYSDRYAELIIESPPDSAS